jgi:CHAT domain-containing protein
VGPEALFTSADERGSLVGPREALIAFHVGATQSTAWVIRRAGVATSRLPGRAELTRLVEAAQPGWQDPAQDATSALRQLARVVIGPLEPALEGATRVIVIPDGVLHAVPFAALPDASGRALVERLAVAYAPSAGSYLYLRAHARGAGNGAVAIGNPRMALSGPSPTRADDLRRLAWLKPLPYSGDEVRAIGDVFGEAGRVLEQNLATEAAVRSPEVANAAIVHFATHAFLDDDQPGRSGLALTAVPPGSDGVLQAREIYRLKLHAALVTLSACQTARGRMVTGEGMLGLSRAFFYAGADSVMATLWDVNDASTARFMTLFYRQIQRGAAIDAALRDTQRRMARDPAFKHPYYWAPFVAIGHADTPIPGLVRRASFTPSEVAGLSGLVALLAGVALARRHSVSRRIRSLRTDPERG